MTSTTDVRIDGLIQEAARLRGEYNVPTGVQRAPFFEIQTDTFALLAIDTGVVRQIDAEQERWLEGALRRAAGKTIMAIVGHPFFAGGHDVTAGDARFMRLKRLLIDNGVTIAMAGDTHDLEYYLEQRPGRADVYNFVNGGGGAYLSFGTALAAGLPRRQSGTGPTTPTGGPFPERSRPSRPGGNARPGGGRRSSTRGRFPRNGCRPSSTTTWPRSSRASSR